MSTKNNSSRSEQSEKLKAIEAAISQIEKFHGKGSIMRLGHREKIEIETIPTGSIGLDKALGIGGLPVGRIIEIYGAESSGKTTLAMHVVAEAQKMKESCAFIDAEHAFDPSYAKKIGININDLWISQPDTGEEALEIVDKLVRSGAMKVIVVDSVAALVPKAEIDGEMGDSHMGLQARLMSQALRKLAGIVSKSSCTIIFINQIRQKIGVMFGNPETTTGGNALKFYASVRLEVKRTGQIKNGEELVGNEIKVKVVKNKVAPPFRTAAFEIMYGEGISRVGEILDYGVTCGAIDKSGSWYSFNGEKIGQGKESAKNFLKANEDIRKKIEAEITKAASPIQEDEVMNEGDNGNVNSNSIDNLESSHNTDEIDNGNISENEE